MSRFSEKGYFVKENAAIYLTPDMDRTAKWFEEVMGWYSNIVESAGGEISFMQVQRVDGLYRYVTGRG